MIVLDLRYRVRWRALCFARTKKRRTGVHIMPDKKTMARARKDKKEGKAPSTQAGEFVHEEIEHIRAGKHGAANAKQAIAIGLSKARRAGVKLPPPKKGTTSERTRKQAKREIANAAKPGAKTKRPSAKRSRAATKALKRAPHVAASSRALSRHAHQVAETRKRASRRAKKPKPSRSHSQSSTHTSK
jgi:Family of unknown function (DUF6496)